MNLPIYLLGCLYKIISKTLTIKLREVIDPLISKNQFAFISGKQIQDGVLIINEVIDHAQKYGNRCFILKIDLEKAYDSGDPPALFLFLLVAEGLNGLMR